MRKFIETYVWDHIDARKFTICLQKDSVRIKLGNIDHVPVFLENVTVCTPTLIRVSNDHARYVQKFCEFVLKKTKRLVGLNFKSRNMVFTNEKGTFIVTQHNMIPGTRQDGAVMCIDYVYINRYTKAIAIHSKIVSVTDYVVKSNKSNLCNTDSNVSLE
jgi:hypothetical protein